MYKNYPMLKYGYLINELFTKPSKKSILRWHCIITYMRHSFAALLIVVNEEQWHRRRKQEAGGWAQGILSAFRSIFSTQQLSTQMQNTVGLLWSPLKHFCYPFTLSRRPLRRADSSCCIYVATAATSGLYCSLPTNYSADQRIYRRSSAPRCIEKSVETKPRKREQPLRFTENSGLCV